MNLTLLDYVPLAVEVMTEDRLQTGLQSGCRRGGLCECNICEHEA